MGERRKNRNGYKAITSELERSYMAGVEGLAIGCLVVIIFLLGIVIV